MQADMQAKVPVLVVYAPPLNDDVTALIIFDRAEVFLVVTTAEETTVGGFGSFYHSIIRLALLHRCRRKDQSEKG
jgi:hypothetical protein